MARDAVIRYREDLEWIAALSGCDESHVRRQTGRAFLAPDIVEDILGGRRPKTLQCEDIAYGFSLYRPTQREAIRDQGDLNARRSA